MLKQTTLRSLAPLSLALALATGGLALSAPAFANQAAQQAATATARQLALPQHFSAVAAQNLQAAITLLQARRHSGSGDVFGIAQGQRAR